MKKEAYHPKREEKVMSEEINGKIYSRKTGEYFPSDKYFEMRKKLYEVETKIRNKSFFNNTN